MDGSVRLWRFHNWHATEQHKSVDSIDPTQDPDVLLFSKEKPGVSDRPVLSLAVNLEGNILASGMAYQGICLWNVDANGASFKTWLPQDH